MPARYIELNPLRAGMVADPGDYPWSSHRRNAYGEHDPLVSPHPAYLALSTDPTQRLQAYRALVRETIDPTEVEAIRLHLQRQHAYGTGRFRAAIEAQLGRVAGPQKIGRPRKPNAAQKSRL
ncbi:hypothetical protein ACFPOA_09850 [Lysobacter niabensis]|uniref:hypothetical protein n=1 Tax=Agrilutibacter niabensis TaxID=380628 RepID=UPI00360BF2EC